MEYGVEQLTLFAVVVACKKSQSPIQLQDVVEQTSDRK